MSLRRVIRLSSKACFKYIVLMFMSAALCGCMFDVPVETLLSPPKLSALQAEMYDALTESAGSGIELVYPRSGEYRNPFVIFDLDSSGFEKGDDEAIVFYRKISADGLNTETPLRMNILDRIDGRWRSVCERTLSGVDIDSISFQNFFGPQSSKNILLSCTLLTAGERMLYVLGYDSSALTEYYSGSYSYMDIVRLNEYDRPRIFLINNNTEPSDLDRDSSSAAASSAASVIGSYVAYEGSNKPKIKFGTLSTASLNIPDLPTKKAIQKFSVQKLSISSALFFLDFSVEDNNYASLAILYSSDRLSFVSGPFFRKINPYTPTLYCRDIDGDGRIEIPTMQQAQEDEALDDDERILFVYWLVTDEEKNLDLSLKFTTCISPGGEYIFYIPTRWQDKITAVRTGRTINFYLSEQSSVEAYSKEKLKTPLLSICIAPENPEGWTRYEKSKNEIYIKTFDNTHPMSLTEDELSRCLTDFN